jgi:hypothetical protein
MVTTLNAAARARSFAFHRGSQSYGRHRCRGSGSRPRSKAGWMHIRVEVGPRWSRLFLYRWKAIKRREGKPLAQFSDVVLDSQFLGRDALAD